MAIVVPRPPFDSGIDIVLGGVQEQEIAIQRDLTHQFIHADPTEITLQAHTRSRTSAGGWQRVAGATRAVQSVKVIIVDENADPVVTPDGVERRAEFILLCDYDAVVEVGDTFTMRGAQWEVIGMVPALPYEVRALVARHGG